MTRSLSFDQALERIADGRPVTLHLSELSAEARPMRVECSWCRKVMIEGDPPVSHGICSPCAIKHGYADQADLVKPEDLVPGVSDEEIAAAQERCRPAVEAAAFPGSLPDAVAANAARTVGRVAWWIGGALIGLVNAIGAFFIARSFFAGVARTLGIALGYTLLVVGLFGCSERSAFGVAT